MKPLVAFFEIPAVDIERAVRFYGMIFKKELEVLEYGDEKMAFIYLGEGAPTGCVFSLKGYVPTSNGITISFFTEALDEALERVKEAGGKVSTPPCETCEGSNEFFAYFLDTEGNRIGLFTRNIPPLVL